LLERDVFEFFLELQEALVAFLDLEELGEHFEHVAAILAGAGPSSKFKVPRFKSKVLPQFFEVSTGSVAGSENLATSTGPL